MRKHARFAICVLLVAGNVFAQETVQWSRRFDSTSGVTNISTKAGAGYYVSIQTQTTPCVVAVDDSGKPADALCLPVGTAPRVLGATGGGFYLDGTIGPPGFADPAGAELSKHSADGEEIWRRRLEAPEPIAILDGDNAPDGGIVVVGSYGNVAGPKSGSRASFAAKLADDGVLEWFHVFDVTGSDAFVAVRTVADGYAVGVAGDNYSGVAMLDMRGAAKWYRWFGEAKRTLSIDVLRSGEVVAVGPAARRYWIARIDRAGNVVSEKIAPGVDGAFLKEVIARADGSVVALATESTLSGYSARFVTFDEKGELLWQRSIRFPKDRWPRVIHAARDGGFLFTTSESGHDEIHRFSPNGDPPSCLAAGAVVSSLKFSERNLSSDYQPTVSYEVISARSVTKSVTLTRRRLETSECRSIGPPAAAEPVKAPSAAERSAMRVYEAIEAERKELSERVVNLLASRDFAELDRLGDTFRRPADVFPDGYPRLAVFYTALITPAEKYGDRAQHLSLLKEWMNSHLRSASAATALARAYVNYAFESRGEGYSPGVTTQAWVEYESLIKEAAQIVVASEAVAADDPEFQIARIYVAGNSCAPELETIVHDPRLRTFAYHRLWRQAAFYFLPRWCGSGEKYRKLAEYAAAATKSTYGEGLYGYMAWDAINVERERQRVAEYKFDWPRVRQGLRDLIARYPSNILFYHRLAALSRYFEDRQTLTSTLAAPQSAWSAAAKEAWGSEGNFEEAKTWAAKPAARFMKPASPSSVTTTDGSTSWITSSVSKWPPVFLQNELKFIDGASFLFNSFSRQERQGIVAVSALSKLGRLETVESHGRMLPNIVPISAQALRTKFRSWTMYEPKHKSRSVTIDDIRALSIERLVAVMPLPGKLAVQVLTPHPAAERLLVYLGRVYVVGCRPGSSPCEQMATAGTIRGSSRTPGQYVSFNVVVDEPVDWSELIGSPVLNESGRVVAIIVEPADSSTGDNRQVVNLRAADIASVLDLAADNRKP